MWESPFRPNELSMATSVIVSIGPGDFRLTQSVVDENVLLVEARGELDISTTPALRATLEAGVDEGHRQIVVDLSEVSFIDSVGLAAIVTARHRLGDEGRLAVVVDPNSYATLIIEVAGVDSLIGIVHTRDQALAVVRAD